MQNLIVHSKEHSAMLGALYSKPYVCIPLSLGTELLQAAVRWTWIHRSRALQTLLLAPLLVPALVLLVLVSLHHATYRHRDKGTTEMQLQHLMQLVVVVVLLLLLLLLGRQRSIRCQGVNLRRGNETNDAERCLHPPPSDSLALLTVWSVMCIHTRTRQLCRPVHLPE